MFAEQLQHRRSGRREEATTNLEEAREVRRTAMLRQLYGAVLTERQA